MYRCLFNHELLIAGTTQTPCQRYEDDICDEQLRLFMDELCDTDVDAVMLCPTAWRRNLWHSKVDPHWEEEAPASVLTSNIMKRPITAGAGICFRARILWR